ncbi:hypothetical protein BCR42DRAFT_70174 [Absidia repens]|uniref:Survival Motor Neuron Gemin2-binding domain-containing protein n=1 Tax=Absidia repens TaxID=90262 RepID=A0A1X2IAW4_9FUNG|nr:hypothetical protein BCR42DRAFT_70174 [Absidia repens]
MNGEDPYIGQVIYNTGGGKGDAWDDSELIDFWDKAKEAYKKRQDPQNKKTTPFSTEKRYKHKQRIEKRTSLKRKTPSPTLPPKTPIPPRSPPTPQTNDNDSFTHMIMAWYYAGYYTGLYIGGSNSAQ